MESSTVRNVFLGLTSSLFLFAAWPPSDLNFLLFIAFVPVLIMVFEQKKTWNAFFVFYLVFQFFLIMLHAPLLIRDHTIPLIIGLTLVPIFWSIPIALSHQIGKRYGVNSALFLFPFFYLSQEIAQYYWDFGITYFNMGVGLSNNPIFLGIYPYAGQEGGTLLIMAFNVSLVFIFRMVMEGKFKLYFVSPVIVLLLIMIGTYYFKPIVKKIDTVNIAIFQPDKPDLSEIQNSLVGQIDLLESELIKNKDKKMDLIICPESYLVDMEKFPLIVNNLKDHSAIQRLKSLSYKYQAPIFSGATLVQLYRAQEPPTSSAKSKSNEPGVYFDIYNGSLFITPDQEVFWRTKQSLVPFSESIPFYKAFNFLEKKGLWPTRYDKTYGTVAFDGPYRYKNLSIAPAICFESVFPIVIQSYIQETANLIVVLSTSWTTSKRVLDQQQDAMPIIQRSFGKSLIYATLDQESSITDYNGQRHFSEFPFEIKEIALYDTSSLYASYASKPWIWFFFTLGLLGLVMLRKKSFKYF